MVKIFRFLTNFWSTNNYFFNENFPRNQENFYLFKKKAKMATLKETPRFVDECIRSHFVEFIFNKSFNGDIFKDPTIFSSNQATKLEITLEEGWSDDLGNF